MKVIKLILILLLVFALTACGIEPPEPNYDFPLPLINQETLPNVTETEPEPEPEPPFTFNIFEELPTELLHSKSAYLYNITADYLVYAKNESERLPPASTLKIMTALITLENIEDLNELITVPDIAFEEFRTKNPNKEGIARIGIERNQGNLTYLDALYALMIASCCEISNVLAYNVGGGDISAFVDMMNVKTAELGLTDTNFTNAHGLHEEGNYSSARDMLLIAKYGYENYPMFVEITEQILHIMPPTASRPNGFSMSNRCSLSREEEGNPYFFEGARAIKTGGLDYVYEMIDSRWVEFDGLTCLVSRFIYDDEVYILSTFNAPWLYGQRPIIDEDGNELRRLHYTYLDHKLIYQTMLDKLFSFSSS